MPRVPHGLKVYSGSLLAVVINKKGHCASSALPSIEQTKATLKSATHFVVGIEAVRKIWSDMNMLLAAACGNKDAKIALKRTILPYRIEFLERRLNAILHIKDEDQQSRHERYVKNVLMLMHEKNLELNEQQLGAKAQLDAMKEQLQEDFQDVDVHKIDCLVVAEMARLS